MRREPQLSVRQWSDRDSWPRFPWHTPKVYYRKYWDRGSWGARREEPVRQHSLFRSSAAETPGPGTAEQSVQSELAHHLAVAMLSDDCPEHPAQGEKKILEHGQINLLVHWFIKKYSPMQYRLLTAAHTITCGGWCATCSQNVDFPQPRNKHSLNDCFDRWHIHREKILFLVMR